MRLLTLLLIMSPILSINAQELVFHSGSKRTHLIELFTSQGCSSCPPAEEWLSKLKSQPGLWTNFVPLGFHVDYWDRLGWRDPFASKEWTARQNLYAGKWNSESVYTPGFVLDGREWSEPNVPPISQGQAGVLRITLANGKIAGEFDPKSSSARDFYLHFATLGFNLTSRVTAGENKGRDLRQDFVVLSLVNQKMAGGRAEIPFPSDPRPGAIAAWITVSNNLEPIQAVGGWLK